MPSANLQSTSALRKKNLYGEAMSRSDKGMKKKKDYDYAQALWKSKKKSTGGHLHSIDPTTGAVLKKKHHPTYGKLLKGEEEQGNIVVPVRGKGLSIKSKYFKGTQNYTSKGGNRAY